MPTFILMTKLSPGAMAHRRQAGHEWKQAIERLCPELRWIAHYALLGPYDFMDIYEAPDNQAAFRVSLLSRERGAVRAESWPATSYEEFLPLADQVEQAGGAGKPPAKAG